MDRPQPADSGSSTWRVALENGKVAELDNPYGMERVLSRPGAYQAEILLSPINQRIQVLSYDGPDIQKLAEDLDELALANSFGKVWVKARIDDQGAFEETKFIREAFIPRYFDGTDALIYSLFTLEERTSRPFFDEEGKILSRATEGTVPQTFRSLPPGYTTHLFSEADAAELAALYGQVFPTYPYPIDKPEYLIETAQSHILYRLVRSQNGELVAAASAETVPHYRCAEMTDFASLPSERGKGLAQFLLKQLEDDAVARFNIQCFYTIARALSLGMLRTFHNGGYVFGGTLVNNCSIAGQFETMHVLYKP